MGKALDKFRKGITEDWRGSRQIGVVSSREWEGLWTTWSREFQNLSREFQKMGMTLIRFR